MCVLRAVGPDFDPVGFLRNRALRACRVFQRGDPNLASRPEGPKSDFAGFYADVSDRDDLSGQVEDAIRFLETHRIDIQELQRTAGIELVYLDFLVELGFDGEAVYVQNEYLAPELLKRVGTLEIGVAMTLWPTDRITRAFRDAQR